MTTAALLSLLFVLSASGQSLPQSGVNKVGFPRTPEGEQVFEDAGRQPNATSSVTFKRTFERAEENWTWRINVTEVAVPNNLNDIGKESANYSQGLRVAHTQWQLEWPGDEETLQDYLARTNRSIRISEMISDKPRNITDRYKDEDNGNCTSVLGDKCTRSLTLAASSSGSVSFSSVKDCEDTLPINRGGLETNVGFGFNQNQNSSDESTPLHRDGTLFFSTSSTYQTGNLTYLNQAKGSLHVFVMNFKNNASAQYEPSMATVLCRIVDKAAADSGNPGSDQPDRPSAASGRRRSMGAVLGTFLFSALFTV